MVLGEPVRSPFPGQGVKAESEAIQKEPLERAQRKTRDTMGRSERSVWSLEPTESPASAERGTGW